MITCIKHITILSKYKLTGFNFKSTGSLDVSLDLFDGFRSSFFAHIAGYVINQGCIVGFRKDHKASK